MTVGVSVPRLLIPATGGPTRFEIEAETVGELVENLLVECPGLRVHLFDESGHLRPHVLCFVDGEASRLDDRERPVAAEVRFIQAVSGG